jgi:hypothetical protein
MSEKLLIVRLFAIAALTIAVVVACDSVPLTSPTGSTITLSIDRSVLPLDGQATVTAVLTESSGTAVHNGTVVTFQPSIGTVIPVEARTVNGVATTTFMAGARSGSGTIHAFSGSARTGSGNSSGSGVTVTVGAAAAGSIAVTATPPSVSQSGGTVTISALVMDPSNNPLPGVSVLFTTTTGTLSATTALSDSSGVARTALATTQTATVTAIAGTAKGETRVEVSTAPPVQIAISPEPAIVGVPVAITVSSNSSPGARQVQSMTVDFGDGTSETRSNITGSAAFTHTYQREGAVTVSARVIDVAGNTGSTSRALIVQRTQPRITLSSTDPSASLSGSENGTITFTVNTTAPAAGDPPIQSVVVRRDDGTVIYSSNATGSQQFAHRFSSVGTYTITATATDAAGSTGTSSIVVTITP